MGYDFFDSDFDDSKKSVLHEQDVRKSAKTVISVFVMLYILMQLRSLIFTPISFGVGMTWIAWAIFLLFVGSVAYLGALLVMKFLGKVFSIKWERDAADEMLLFWVVVLLCGLALYTQFPNVYTAIDSFVIYHFRDLAVTDTLDFARARLVPFNVLGIYAGILYVSLFVMLFVGVVLLILKSGHTLREILSAMFAPFILIGIILILSYLNFEQFTLHRIWGIFLVLAIVGLHIALSKMISHVKVWDDSQKKGFRIYTVFRRVPNPCYNHIVDRSTVIGALYLTILSQGILLITFIVYTATNFRILFDMGAMG